MKNICTLGLAVAVAALLAPATVSAQTYNAGNGYNNNYNNNNDRDDLQQGWYLGGAGILYMPTDADSKSGGLHDTIDYDTGWGVAGSGGYAWGNGWRTEGEVAYSKADINKLSGPGTSASDGHMSNTDFMGNVLYDIATGTRFTPYLGVGAGAALDEVNYVGVMNGNRYLNDERLKFAYQGIAGVSMRVDRHWAVTADYRYVGTTDPHYNTTAGDSARTEYGSNNVLVGIRYTFGEPAAPPPPPPPPPPMARMAPPPPPPMPAPAAAPAVAPVPQSYMVFFDFDRSELTPEARRIIASAAQDYRNGHFVRLVVTGHTDTVGTSSYNMRLGQRRADSVKREMIADGVPAATIEAVSAGKTGLLVPTANGVREAQNRRAEIVLSK